MEKKTNTYCLFQNKLHSKNDRISELDVYINQAKDKLKKLRNIKSDNERYLCYVNALKLYNAALVLNEKNEDVKQREKDKKYLVEAIAKIELNFIRNDLKLVTDWDVNRIIEKNIFFKDSLKKFRNEIESKYAVIDDTDTKGIIAILNDIKMEIRSFLEDIFNDCNELLGKQHACKYALLGLGSFRSLQMTPYSDFESIFIIENKDQKSNQANKEYFINLFKLFELRIINLGETDIAKWDTNLLPAQSASPIPKGFSLDEGKSPLGIKKDGSLIGTVNELAEYIKEKNWIHRENCHLSMALLHVDKVLGDDNLLDIYKDVFIKTLSDEHKQSVKTLLAPDLIRFDPRFTCSHFNDTSHYYNIKIDFYRLPNLILDTFSIIYSLKTTDLWSRIDELSNKNILSKEGTENLKKAITRISHLRLSNYKNYNFQHDFAYPKIGEDISHKKSLLSNEEIIFEIYFTLIPFFKFALYLVDKTVEAPVPTLYDNSTLIRGLIYEKILHNYPKALENYEKGKNFGYTFMARLLCDKGDYHKALEYIEKALLFIINDLGVENVEYICALNIRASIYGHLNHYDTAINEYNFAYEKSCNLFKTHENSYCLFIKSNYAILLFENSHYQKAREAMKAVLNINLKLYGEFYHDTYMSYIDNACVDLKLNNIDECEFSLKRALEIGKKLFKDIHPKMIVLYNVYGSYYRKVDNKNKAEEYFEKSLSLSKRFNGIDHYHTLVSISNLIVLFSCNPNLKRTLEYFSEFLDIYANKNKVTTFHQYSKKIQLAINVKKLTLQHNNLNRIFYDLIANKHLYKHDKKNLIEIHCHIAALFEKRKQQKLANEILFFVLYLVNNYDGNLDKEILIWLDLRLKNLFGFLDELKNEKNYQEYSTILSEYLSRLSDDIYVTDYEKQFIRYQSPNRKLFL